MKYKFARVFRIPQEPTIHQRFGILLHQVLERFHAREEGAGTLPELLGMLEAGFSFTPWTRLTPLRYAAMRPLSTTVSETRSSAAVSSSAPARGAPAALASRRRNARAPGTPWNKPCRCRVMACSRVPAASSRSI